MTSLPEELAGSRRTLVSLLLLTPQLGRPPPRQAALCVGTVSFSDSQPSLLDRLLSHILGKGSCLLDFCFCRSIDTRGNSNLVF